MLLASNKTPFFEIVIAEAAPPAVYHAASELQQHIDLMTLAFPSIVTDASSLPQRAILIGESKHARELFPDVEAAQLPREGYVIEMRGTSILLLGGSPRGTLYAVYDFLERLGVRWWTPTETTVPQRSVLAIEPLKVEVRPTLLYRALWYRHTMDADWQARLRLNGGSMGPMRLQERHGVGEGYAGGASAHTYEPLVPTEQYFDRHPEYFSEINGMRLRHMNQLCPTHPDVADIAAETIRQWLQATPDARIASVTQNDWGNYCTCPRCAAMIEHEGAPSGPALHLANEVARRLEKEHPEVLIDTFAYAWSEKPPAHLQAHPNVLVRIAPIGNCFGHSIRQCAANAGCREALEQWSKISQNLFIWHYVTDFFHYLPPFPNLPPLQDDLNNFLAHNVKGIFLQGNGTSRGGDMPELKAYLMARLLWHPAEDAAAVRHEFLAGYYRDAAPAVEEYVHTFERAFAEAGPTEHLLLYRSLWQNEAGYLEEAVLQQARAALERGRKATADDPQVLERLHRIEMSLDYTQLFYHQRPEPRVVKEKTITCSVSAQRKKLTERFFTTAARNSITHYAEDLGRYTTMSSLRRAWRDSSGKHELIELQAGGMRALLAPALGGRILEYGSADGTHQLLGQSSPATFGYPCAGGYEEYSMRPHQSPGFSEPFTVQQKLKGEVTLTASLESGLALERVVQLNDTTGDVTITSHLRNRTDTPLAGCLRPHLEIDLRTPLATTELWLLHGDLWEQETGSITGAWYGAEVPDGWALWSPLHQEGVWQTWQRHEVEASFAGTIASEPTVLALDLLHRRENQAIAPHGFQRMTHSFGRLTKPVGC